jgi:hypothetical protein
VSPEKLLADIFMLKLTFELKIDVLSICFWMSELEVSVWFC